MPWQLQPPYCMLQYPVQILQACLCQYGAAPHMYMCTSPQHQTRGEGDNMETCSEAASGCHSKHSQVYIAPQCNPALEVAWES